MFRRNEGFTLVELLIVLAVIAALLATITPVAINAVNKAKATQVAANLRNIKSAVEQCITVEQSTGTTCTSVSGLVSAAYLNKDPGGDYGIGDPSVSNNVISIWIGYKGSVDTNRIIGVYSEATTTGCASSVGSGYNICVEARMGKFW